MIKIMDREEWRDRAIEHGTELRKVKKQLEIAVKYLKKLTHKEDWRLAREALQKINEVENEYVALDNQTK